MTKEQKQGLNGRVIQGVSKAGKDYKAYEIYWIKPNGEELSIKQVFLSDLELEMIEILSKA